MEIKSDTPLRIKIGGFLILISLLFLETFFSPPIIFDIPRWLILTLLTCLLVGYFLLILNPAIKQKKDADKISNMYLMSYGRKIPVDLTKCEVIENSNTESIIVYKHNVDNKIETFSTKPLTVDKPFLLSKLMGKRETIIYVDNKDRNKYFFDIDFIYE